MVRHQNIMFCGQERALLIDRDSGSTLCNLFHQPTIRKNINADYHTKTGVYILYKLMNIPTVSYKENQFCVNNNFRICLN